MVTADLIAVGNQVVAYDNLSTGAKRAIHKDAESVVGELSDQEVVEKCDPRTQCQWRNALYCFDRSRRIDEGPGEVLPQ